MTLAPPAAADRRRQPRRAEDRRLAREAAFLERAMALVSDPAPADIRIADLLALVARTAGAAQAAVLTDQGRRTIVASVPDEALAADGEALGRWLDEAAPAARRRRLPGARQSYGARQGIAILVPRGRGRASAPIRRPAYRVVPLPGPDRALIGLAFRSGRSATAADERFPEPLATLAAAVLASLAMQLEREGELEALRRSDAERRRFVSTVAHELRTPLASLSGYLDLTVEHESDDPAASDEFIERARDLVAGMSTLVADLLELSKLGAGQLRVEPGPFSGADTAQAAIRDVMPLAMARDIRLEASLPTRLRTVHADRRRVLQILVNLLANAIKFAPASTSVTLSLAFDGPIALYSLRDEGAGISREDRARIFEPFHRAAGAARIVGTGLGLPIARDLARLMSGELDVASSPGRGSVFVIALPALPGIDSSRVGPALRRALRAAEASLAAPPSG